MKIQSKGTVLWQTSIIHLHISSLGTTQCEAQWAQVIFSKWEKLYNIKAYFNVFYNSGDYRCCNWVPVRFPLLLSFFLKKKIEISINHNCNNWSGNSTRIILKLLNKREKKNRFQYHQCLLGDRDWKLHCVSIYISNSNLVSYAFILRRHILVRRLKMQSIYQSSFFTMKYKHNSLSIFLQVLEEELSYVLFLATSPFPHQNLLSFLVHQLSAVLRQISPMDPHVGDKMVSVVLFCQWNLEIQNRDAIRFLCKHTFTTPWKLQRKSCVRNKQAKNNKQTKNYPNIRLFHLFKLLTHR